MKYAEYLRARAGECVKLAVQDPWARDTAALIDLAQDYRAWARGAEREAAHTGSRGEGTGFFAGAQRLFGHA